MDFKSSIIDLIDTIRLRELTHLTDATINTALRNLQNLGIIAETTGQKRNRLFCYSAYLNLLNQKMDFAKG